MEHLPAFAWNSCPFCVEYSKKTETSISEQETAGATTQFQLFQSMGDFFWKALHYDYEATKEQIHKAFYGGHYAWVHTLRILTERATKSHYVGHL